MVLGQREEFSLDPEDGTNIRKATLAINPKVITLILKLVCGGEFFVFNAEGAPCENDVFEIILSQYGSVLMVLPLGMNSECNLFSTLSAGESVDYATVFFVGPC